MKLNNFKKYSNFYSKDPKNFEKKIVFATSSLAKLPMFEVVTTVDSALQISKDIPVIQWNNFNFSSSKIDESFCSTVYNQSKIPSTSELNSEFKEESFIPKKISDRSLVKKMKFPIIGISANGSDEFKTYNKFKKSEIPYNYFQEKLIPSTRFEILVSGKSPLHIQKKINGIPFDIDMNRWKHLGEALNICKKINDRWKPEYYVVALLESNGLLYLESINRSVDLTPSQGVKLYESAYEDYYCSRLPDWFKNKMFGDYIEPYYKKQYYSSLLLKPSGVIDYKKYIN